MTAKTSASDPIRVDFVPLGGVPGRLGMTFAPGKRQHDAITGQWDRDLAADLRRLREEIGVELLVCLVESHELEELRIPDLPKRCAELGIEFHHFPIPDADVPADLAAAADLARRLAERVRAGTCVSVHCKGGLGRTGLLVAATLAAFGIPPAEAIPLVRKTRPGAIETRGQERCVWELAALI